MSPTVNFTGTVEKDLLKRLKIIAAKLATSINALFNAELRHLVETYCWPPVAPLLATRGVTREAVRQTRELEGDY